MPFADAKICIKIKKNSKRCGAVAVSGTDYCRNHGGAMIRANTKHGLYSKYHPPDLDNLMEEQRANPRLMDLREQVVLVSSLLAYAMKQIKERQEKLAKVPAKKKKGKPIDPALNMKEIESLVGLSDKVSNTIERTARIGLVVRYLVHLDTIERVLREWQEIAREFIPNGHRRQKFNELLSVRAAQIVKEEAEAKSRENKGSVKNLREWNGNFGKKGPEVIDVNAET